jgi:hypothetical protein
MSCTTATTEVRLHVEELRGLFAYAQLPARLQEVSKPFGELAERICDAPVWGNQTVQALHFLLIAKDAAVRATAYAERVMAERQAERQAGG